MISRMLDLLESVWGFVQLMLLVLALALTVALFGAVFLEHRVGGETVAVVAAWSLFLWSLYSSPRAES